MLISVRGKRHEWTFKFYGTPADIKEWQADGLEVYQVENFIPAIITELGLARLWCFFQDIFNFKRWN